jgi:hypothetical protein
MLFAREERIVCLLLITNWRKMLGKISSEIERKEVECNFRSTNKGNRSENGTKQEKLQLEAASSQEKMNVVTFAFHEFPPIFAQLQISTSACSQKQTTRRKSTDFPPHFSMLLPPRQAKVHDISDLKAISSSLRCRQANRCRQVNGKIVEIKKLTFIFEAQLMREENLELLDRTENELLLNHDKTTEVRSRAMTKR